MDFLTALGVFNFLCLPPKGFFIDKALGSVGSAVGKKLLMKRLVIGTCRGWCTGATALMKPQGSPDAMCARGGGTRNAKGGHTENRSQVGLWSGARWQRGGCQSRNECS